MLGIDASLRGTGLAVVEWQGSKAVPRHWEVVKMPPQARHSECLRAIRERMDAVLAAHRPEAAAMAEVRSARRVAICCSRDMTGFRLSFSSPHPERVEGPITRPERLERARPGDECCNT